MFELELLIIFHIGNVSLNSGAFETVQRHEHYYTTLAYVSAYLCIYKTSALNNRMLRKRVYNGKYFNHIRSILFDKEANFY